MPTCRREQIGHLAAVRQRAVADILVAAAVVADAGPVGVEHRAVIERSERRARRRARIDVVAVLVDAREDRRCVGRHRRIQTRVGVVALESPQWRLVVELQTDHRIDALARPAAADLQAMGFGAAVLCGAGAQIQRRAVGLLLENEVDHAGDRIRAVHRRGAAGEDLDPVDQRHRDVRDVGEIAVAEVGLRVVGDAPAVDQHERVVRAEAAQIDADRARRKPVRVRVVVHRSQVLRQRGHDLVGRTESAVADLLRGDRDDGCGSLDLRARDARTGDGHRVQLRRRGRDRCLRRRRRRGGRRCRRGAARRHRDRSRIDEFRREAAAREQPVERDGGRQPAVRAGRSRIADVRSGGEHLHARLSRIFDQRARQRLGGDGEVARVGRGLRAQRGRGGQGEREGEQTQNACLQSVLPPRHAQPRDRRRRRRNGYSDGFRASDAGSEVSPFKGEVWRGMVYVLRVDEAKPSPPNPPLEGEGFDAFVIAAVFSALRDPRRTRSRARRRRRRAAAKSWAALRANCRAHWYRRCR